MKSLSRSTRQKLLGVDKLLRPANARLREEDQKIVGGHIAESMRKLLKQ